MPLNRLSRNRRAAQAPAFTVASPPSGDAVALEAFAFTNGGTSGVASLSVNMPSNPVAGEVLTVVSMVEDAIGTAEITTATSGWTRRLYSWSAAADVAIAVFTKTAVGSDGNMTVEHQTGNSIAWSMRWSGANTTTPLDTNSAAGSAGSAASHAIPTMTPAVDGCLPVYALVLDATTANSLPHSVAGTGWAEEDEQSSDDTQINQVSGSWGVQPVQTNATATGAATVTPAISDGASYCMFAVRPE